MGDTEDFGVWLGRQLRRGGLSQAEFAQRLGLTRAAVSAWVTGRARPRPELMPRIAEILRTDLATLLTRDADAGSARPIGWHHRPAPRDGGRDYGNAAGALGAGAGLASLVREVTQNSLDQRLDPHRPVRVRFTVHELTGEHLYAFLAALKWQDLEPHYAAAATPRHRTGRALAEGLRALKEESSLLLLRIDDYNASGLTGPEYGDGPYAALVRRQLDSHRRDDHGGGSHGLGKAALWAATRLGLVLVHSTLSARHEGRTARRVVGRLDLPWREVDGVAYAGPAWLGEPDIDREREGVTRSWWADERTVADLRLDRDGDDPGTSLLLVGAHDPTGAATTLDGMSEALAAALGDHFWAALTSGPTTAPPLEASVRALRNGETVIPERRVAPDDRHPVLAHALRTHLAGHTRPGPAAEGRVAAVEVPLHVPPLRTAGPGATAHTHRAVLLLTRAASGGATDATHHRVVCLRGTRMTITTRRPGHHGPADLHAVLLAGTATGADDATAHAAEAFLRAAEPPGHHRWTTTGELLDAYGAEAPHRLADFHTAVDTALRALLDTPADPGRQDTPGPALLRDLLRLDGPATATARRGPAYPTVDRVHGAVDAAGAWTLDVTLSIPHRAERRWRLLPVARCDVRSGGRPTLPWSELVATENCTVLDGRLIVAPDVRTARFRAVTEAADHPVAAALAAVTVDVRQAREVPA
ncbi:helix-turn-helix transcriptional regulator [Streptomyces sp. RerS4]|uniref:helix-turn-helix domain-containing protein n=1 Tax=Streptomyces sp. RerS4 TaxID=2942449 RepID=UPI00201BABB5|nr:helix-turn-helix transcriptional regulator [Streptomyces sp. RerS4]UQX03990.1 helix-turn-helix domain-containing protein [Streptomyces sp. RerS4]